MSVPPFPQPSPLRSPRASIYIDRAQGKALSAVEEDWYRKLLRNLDLHIWDLMRGITECLKSFIFLSWIFKLVNSSSFLWCVPQWNLTQAQPAAAQKMKELKFIHQRELILQAMKCIVLLGNHRMFPILTFSWHTHTICEPLIKISLKLHLCYLLILCIFRKTENIL